MFIKAIGLDTKLYGLHSFRIGWASADANNYLPDRVIKKHGRWKSEKAKGIYCREDILHQLLVTLSLCQLALFFLIIAGGFLHKLLCCLRHYL